MPKLKTSTPLSTPTHRIHNSPGTQKLQYNHLHISRLLQHQLLIAMIGQLLTSHRSLQLGSEAQRVQFNTGSNHGLEVTYVLANDPKGYRDWQPTQHYNLNAIIPS